jgi:ABC-type multidrug transport system permease subunit
MKRGTHAARGIARHFLITLGLNFRSRQAILYGYLVPILFLAGFGTVFRAENPALLGEMGQLLTITILGGACFGMPTALVAERERGIWRRYQLLPVATGNLVLSVMAVRVVIVASAALLQVVMAHMIYHTPFPENPVQTIAGVLIVTGSFLGLGLLVTALADDVPSVQALGQCVFLPMILIGGVGIPLAALPAWAQRLAGFMPGRYAVEVLQLGYADPQGMRRAGFSILALLVIGVAAATAGSVLFRWDSGRHIRRGSWAWIALALAAWVAVGTAAGVTGRLQPVGSRSGGYQAVTEEEIGAIGYGNLPGDNEFVSRLAPPFGNGGLEGMGAFAATLKDWQAGKDADVGQRARNLLCVAGIADVSEDIHEGEIARLVFDDLRSELGDERLTRVLAWIILYPQEGAAITSAPELGFGRRFREDIIRERTVLYATKFLGRLRGKIRD